MEYLLVGIGGAFGSISRFALGKWISEHSKTSLPIGTFIINITGAFLLGILVAFQNFNNVYLLLGDGFLGAFTTFSTFMYEGLSLFQRKERIAAIKYIVGSLILGVIAFVIGMEIGKFI